MTTSSGPRILYVINGFQRGGAEQGLVELVRNGAFADCDLTIVSLVGGSAEIIGDLRALGATVTPLTDQSRMTPRALMQATVRLPGLLRRLRPHALVLSLPQANILGRLATLAWRPRVIASFEHNTHLAKPIYELLYWLTSPRVDWLLADAEATAVEARRRLYRTSPKSVVVLPLVSFPPAPPPAGPRHAGPLRLVNAARFTAVKNQIALVEAVGLLKARGVDCRLTLYGEGPQRDACLTRIRELDLESVVDAPGFVDNWAERGDHDLFVLTSRHEGLCIVALEAMNRGYALAAPWIGGIRDYGRPDCMHRLADVEPESLADAIAALSKDRDRLSSIASAGWRMVQATFGVSAVRQKCAAFNQALTR